MTVDVRSLGPMANPNRLIALMVQLLPTPEDVSCFDAVVDLLRSPSTLFGPPAQDGIPDARCMYATWDELGPPLDVLEECGISVTYIRHLLHLAAHFAARNAIRRDGTAVLSLFDEGASVSFRYELPIQADVDRAFELTLTLWNELASVDLLRANVLFSFVSRPDLGSVEQQPCDACDPT